MVLPPLSLYVHIPWCVRKCPYCDFNSHQAGDDIPEAAYIDSLLADLAADAPYAQGRSLHSIFFGGGTPSLFSANGIARILDGAEATLGFSRDIEITLEANPGTIEQHRFSGYRSAGVNRLSIGVQSLQPAHLQQLGRIHSAAEAKTAVVAAQRAGFDNINVDLMHGLPGQTTANAVDDLQQAMALAPSHLSWYQLTIEPNTAFYSQPPTLPEEDQLADIEEAGQQLLAAQGFAAYEISAYAQNNRQCAHNLNYWAFGDYLGIGAGAHGKITAPAQGEILRSQKTRHPTHYLQQWQSPQPQTTLATDRWQPVADDALPLEFMMNALRLRQGVPLSSFGERTGLPLAQLTPSLDVLTARGLLIRDGDWVRTSDLGRRFLDEILGEFMPQSRR